MHQARPHAHTEPLLIEAQWLFDGRSDAPQADQAVLVQDGCIRAIGTQAREQGRGVRCIQTPVLAPGFIDMQVNGANGVLFNAQPDVDCLHQLMAGTRQGGTAYALPTFITAAAQQYERALEACEQALSNVAGVLGVHLEGPFLSQARAGIHQRDAIRPLTPQDLERLCTPYPGKRIITLAPECVDTHTLAALHAAGWLILAGHTEASAATIHAAHHAGLAGCTHLFNAMPPLQGRTPGVVGSVLAHPQLMATVIADGIHVHPDNLRLSLLALGDKRLCLVSDAMPTLGSDIDQFVLDGRVITRQGNTLTDATGTLAGAHLPMDQAVRNMVHLAGASQASALRMAATAPAHALGLSHELGYLACGYRAGLTLLSADLHAHAVVVDGHLFSNTL